MSKLIKFLRTASPLFLLPILGCDIVSLKRTSPVVHVLSPLKFTCLIIVPGIPSYLGPQMLVLELLPVLSASHLGTGHYPMAGVEEFPLYLE